MPIEFHPLPECRRPSAADFRRDYVVTGRPVVLRGLFSSWPACTKWSPTALATRFPHHTIEVMKYDFGVAPSGVSPYREMLRLPLAEVVSGMGEPMPPNLYVVAQNGMLADPAFAELWEDLPLAPDWFDASAVATHVSVWMGPQGTVTPLHYDLVDTMLAQVSGYKRVLVASPDDTAHMYKGPQGFSLADPESHSAEAFPRLAKACWHRAELAPGDAIFLPGRWWHHVRSLSASISVSLRNFAWS